jgi:hypothetical protein
MAEDGCGIPGDARRRPRPYGATEAASARRASLGVAPMVVREIARLITAVNREDGVSVILVEQNSRMAVRIASHA